MKKHYFIIFIFFSCSVFSDDPPPRESLIKKEYIYLASVLKPDSLRNYPTTVFLGKLKPNGYPPKLIESDDIELATQMTILRNYYTLEIAQENLAYKVFLKNNNDSIELSYLGNSYFQDSNYLLKIKANETYTIVAYKDNQYIKGTAKIPKNINLVDYNNPEIKIDYKNNFSDTLKCKIINDNFNDLFWGVIVRANTIPNTLLYRFDYKGFYIDNNKIIMHQSLSSHKFTSNLYFATTDYNTIYIDTNLRKKNINYEIELSAIDSNYGKFYTGSRYLFGSSESLNKWHKQFDPFNGYDIKNRSSLKTNNPDVIGFVGSINSKNFTFVTKVDTNVTEIIEYQREE